MELQLLILLNPIPLYQLGCIISRGESPGGVAKNLFRQPPGLQTWSTQMEPSNKEDNALVLKTWICKTLGVLLLNSLKWLKFWVFRLNNPQQFSHLTIQQELSRPVLSSIWNSIQDDSVIIIKGFKKEWKAFFGEMALLSETLYSTIEPAVTTAATSFLSDR